MVTRTRRAARRPPVDRPGPRWIEAAPVKPWMRTPVATVRAGTLARAAADLMRARGGRHLPVVDERDRLVGIVTDRDLRQLVFAPAIQRRLGDVTAALASVTVGEVMTCGVVTVTPSTDLRVAARLMHERKIGALPVVENGVLRGIVTESDLLRAFEDALRRQVTTARPWRGQVDGDPYEYGFPRPGTTEAGPNEGTVD